MSHLLSLLKDCTGSAMAISIAARVDITLMLWTCDLCRNSNVKAFTLHEGQARKSLLQSMLAQLRCGSSGVPLQSAQLVAAGRLSGAEPSSLPASHHIIDVDFCCTKHASRA